jgi:CheY-like chemotaxis protein
VIEVIDSGPGIPAGIRDRIFDPFFTTRDVGQGKGLGLSVAYGIVRAHSGSITVGDAPNGGALVTMRIPCARAAGSGDVPGAAARSATRADRGGRILVVDDEPVVLDLITDALGSSHRVETAANGREGLIKAGKESFDLILLDMKMPDMTGRQMFEALAALRPDMAGRVVFTTGDTVQEDTRRFLDSLPNPCLSKPFSLDALGAIVDRMLTLSRSA